MSAADLEATAIGGGYAYVGHGIDLVLVGFTAEVGWWRNSVGFTPDQARRLATILTEQADASDALSLDAAGVDR
jgi:hypothetical protein